MIWQQHNLKFEYFSNVFFKYVYETSKLVMFVSVEATYRSLPFLRSVYSFIYRHLLSMHYRVILLQISTRRQRQKTPICDIVADLISHLDLFLPLGVVRLCFHCISLVFKKCYTTIKASFML